MPRDPSRAAVTTAFVFAGAFALMYLAALTAPAVAQDGGLDGSVSIPWGDWVAVLAGAFGTTLAGLVGFALRALPGPIYAILMTLRVEQLLERSVEYGIQSVAGAARGKQLDVDVGNRVLETAAEYAVRSASDVVEWLGEADLRDKILARLDLEPDATTKRGPGNFLEAIIRGGH